MLLILCGLATATMAVSQQVKKFRTGQIESKTLEIDWANNVWEFSGGTKLVISGDVSANMTAPSMVVRVGKGNRLNTVTAKGPVTFTVYTKPDANGQRRKIVASANDQATYSEDTQTIKLIGGAVADMMPAEGGTSAEAIHFTGKTISANLRTSRLTVDDANLNVKTELQ